MPFSDYCSAVQRLKVDRHRSVELVREERNQERKEKYWSSPTSLVPSSLPRQTPEEQQQRVLKQQKEKSYMEYASVSFKVRKVQLGRRALGRRTPPSSRRRDGIGRGPDLAFQPLFRLPTRLWEQASERTVQNYQNSVKSFKASKARDINAHKQELQDLRDYQKGVSGSRMAARDLSNALSGWVEQPEGEDIDEASDKRVPL